MEILRLAPFPLTVSYDGLNQSEDYVIAILDDHAVDLVEISVTSDANGTVSTQLPNYFSRYDSEYVVEIYEKLKSVLRDEGWNEQTCGEVYINGEYATNFGKDGALIHLSWSDWVDDEEWESCFEEEVQDETEA